jgi:hypothetical protein
MVLGRRALVVARGRLAGRLGAHIQDVQGPSSGWLDGGRLAGVVSDMIAINDVVVPVSLSWRKSRIGEPERALPSTF